jgi:hypothetical protein
VRVVVMLDTSEGSTLETRWEAVALDDDANVPWFDASGATPLEAVTRLAERLLEEIRDSEIPK